MVLGFQAPVFFICTATQPESATKSNHQLGNRISLLCSNVKLQKEISLRALSQDNSIFYTRDVWNIHIHIQEGHMSVRGKEELDVLQCQ